MADIVYTAKDGDRLDTIAFAYYGVEGLESKILEANPNLLRRKDWFLRANEKITLPIVDDSEIDTGFVDVYS